MSAALFQCFSSLLVIPAAKFPRLPCTFALPSCQPVELFAHLFMTGQQEKKKFYTLGGSVKQTGILNDFELWCGLDCKS